MLSSKSMRAGDENAAESIDVSLVSAARSASINLVTLPQEILVQIAGYLDLPTARNFALTTRRLRYPAETRIWSSLHMALNPSYGLHPSTESVDNQYYSRSWEDTGQIADGEYDLMLMEKVKHIMEGMDRGKWSLLRELSMTPRLCALEAMMKVLTLGSANLRSFSYHQFGVYDELFSAECIDLPLEMILGAKLSFSFLTHLSMTYQTAHGLGLVAYLCRSAVNLISLDIRVTSKYSNKFHLTPYYRPRLLDQPTRIRHLNIVLQGRDAAKNGDAETIESLLHHSPDIRQAAIFYRSDTNPDVLPTWKKLAALTKLVDLSWGQLEIGSSMIKTHTTSLDFSCLHRLSAESRAWNLPSDYLPPLSRLQHLFLDCSQTAMGGDPYGIIATRKNHQLAYHLSHQHKTRHFDKFLRDSPQLRTITYYHSRKLATEAEPIFPLLDQLQMNYEPTCTIRSLQRYGRELVHASFRLYEEARLGETGLPDAFSGDEYYPVIFTVGESQHPEHCRTGEYIEFEGMIVPPSVLGEIKDAEGVDVDWDRRGMEVSEEAFEVLLRWQATQKAL